MATEKKRKISHPKATAIIKTMIRIADERVPTARLANYEIREPELADFVRLCDGHLPQTALGKRARAEILGGPIDE